MPFNGLCHSDGLWLLESVCQRYGCPFDTILVAECLGAGDNDARGLDTGLDTGVATLAADIASTAMALGLQCEAIPLSRSALADTATALVATLEVAGVRRAILLVDSDETAVRYRMAGADDEQCMSLDRFLRCADGLLVRIRPATDKGVAWGMLADPRPGRWFLQLLDDVARQPGRRALLLASLLLLLVGVLLPVALGRHLDTVAWGTHIEHLGILFTGLLIVGMAVVMLLTWREAWQAKTARHVEECLAADFVRRLLFLPMAARDGRTSAELAAAFRQGEALCRPVAQAAALLSLELPVLGFAGVALSVLQWQAALALTVVLLVSSVPVFLLGRRAIAARCRGQLAAAGYSGVLAEEVAALETIRYLQMEPAMGRRLGQRQGVLQSAEADEERSRRLLQAVMRGIAVVAVGAVLAVALTSGTSIGTGVAVLLLTLATLRALATVTTLLAEVVAVDRVTQPLRALLGEVAEAPALAPRREAPEAGAIEFEQVAFRYHDDDEWLFRSLSFSVKAGRLTVLVGPSGCGKSTLVKMLLGLEQPDAGRILVGGRDVCHLSREEMRPLFGVVPQESTLFSGTIHANLLAAHSQASFEDMVCACKAAAIHEFIDALPAGYQTVLEEGGRNLSVGQRQRLAIARALLRQPKILVLDESFAALDPPTAEAIGSVLNCLRGEVTVLFITHQIPRGLAVDAAVVLSGEHHLRSLEVVEV